MKLSTWYSWKLLMIYWFILIYNTAVEIHTVDGSYPQLRSDLPETVIVVEDDQPHYLESPNFPKCCEPVKYILKKATDDQKYWKLLFTDLDLPPLSQLLVFGLKDNRTEKELISSARFIDGAWVRPVVLYPGYAISVEFHPAEKTSTKTSAHDYVGFRAAYWLDLKLWQLDKPFTFCPPVTDVFHGGMVQLSHIELAFNPQHYRMHCAWQLKPVPDSDLQIYVKIEKLTEHDSTLKIHQGLTSTSPEIFSATSVDTSQTFTSTEGFYVELAKPTDSGSFKMSFGVYKTLIDDQPCVFKVDGQFMEGFKCVQGEQDLCIPTQYKCDGIRTCSNGEDEDKRICKEPMTTTILSGTTPKPLTTTDYCPRRCKDGQCPKLWNERCPEVPCGLNRKRCPGTLLCILKGYDKCPGEPCADLQRQCDDGTCVRVYEDCKDGSSCDTYQKKCQDGTCVYHSNRCPEDPCPSYKSFRCDVNECLYKSDVCDGYTQCTDGTDERDCSLFTGERGKYWLLMILAGVLFLIICVVYATKKKKSRPAQRERPLSPNEELGQLLNPLRNAVFPDGTSRRSSQPRMAGASPGSSLSRPQTATNRSNQNGLASASVTAAAVPPAEPSVEPAPEPAAEAEPPPSYGDVMSNQDTYPAPTEPPPSYSSVAV